MKLKKAIVHEIKKIEGKTSATEDLSNDLLDVSSSNIIQNLDSYFNKKSPERAVFKEDGFKEDIKDFSNIDLMTVSQTLTKKLKSQIQNVTNAKGGFLLFCEYAIKEDFLAVFLLRNIKDPCVEKRGNKFVLKETVHLEVRDFAMGVKIDLTSLIEDRGKRYIQITRGNTDISQYFKNWIGIKNTKLAAKDSSALLEISNMITIPEDHESIKTRDDLKKAIYDYGKLHNWQIDLRDLSKTIYNNEDKIPEYVSNKNIDIDSEFKLTNRNSFYKIKAKGDGIELSARRPLFSEGQGLITIDGDKVIIRSQHLVDDIKSQK